MHSASTGALLFPCLLTHTPHTPATQPIHPLFPTLQHFLKLTLQKVWQPNTRGSALERTAAYRLVMCRSLFFPLNTQYWLSRARGQLGVISAGWCVFRFQNKIRSRCRNICFSCFVKSRFDSLHQRQNDRHTRNLLSLITPLSQARLCSPVFRLTKCIIPVAWYSYSCANPFRYPQLGGQLVINHRQLLN